MADEIIELGKEQKALLVDKIKLYFERELSLEIGGFDAEFLLDFFAKEMGVHFYNRGLYDGIDAMRVKFEQIGDDIAYALEKSEK